MKNFDSFEIDFRPGVRRTAGACRGIEALIACRGDLGSSKSANTSTAKNYQTTVQGGGSGSGTLAVGQGSSTGNITIQSVDPDIVNSAFQYGAEAQTIAGQTVGQANQTIEDIAGQLASLTANATPQTSAAQSEILAGGSPSGGVSIPNNVVVIATIAAVAIGAVFFFVTRKH